MAILLNGDGYAGITAQEDADLYAGLAGTGRLVLPVGKEMAAEIVDNNTVRIYDGELVTKGRRIHIDAGTYDDFTIPTGTQGTVKYYTLGYQISTSNGKQTCAPAQKSANSVSTTFEEADLRDGNTSSFVSVYRVKQDGINLTSVTALYNTVSSLQDVQAFMDTLNSRPKQLWVTSGGLWPSSSQTITLSEPVSAQKTGIVIVFSYYASDGLKDFGFNSFFVPKNIVAAYPNGGHAFIMSAMEFASVGCKYLYIKDTTITGRDTNNSKGTASGIDYDNTRFAIRAVYGV